ncbi:MAG TPA: hypothetical protein VL122_13600 [Nitrospirota bacterium]|nr:hypothetical protein [Nitrospirota bacterium]
MKDSSDVYLANPGGEWKIGRFKFNLKFIDGNPAPEKSSNSEPIPFQRVQEAISGSTCLAAGPPSLRSAMFLATAIGRMHGITVKMATSEQGGR